MLSDFSCVPVSLVAPLVGAWIEIFRMAWKYRSADVAPLVGAWIEIVTSITTWKAQDGRSSCRSVD